MRELAKEELSGSRARIEELEQELKILLLPKDPNDDKNVIVEIRAGAGGDEAALFAAEIYRMYVHYADSRRWKTEMISLNENGIGGFKECVFMVTGQGAYSRMKYESGVQPCPACAGDRKRWKNPYLYDHGCSDAGGRGSRCSD